MNFYISLNSLSFRFYVSIDVHMFNFSFISNFISFLFKLTKQKNEILKKKIFLLINTLNKILKNQ